MATDRWWLATALAFAPRWIWAVPLAVIVPAAIWQRQRAQWVVLGVSLIALLAISGVPMPADVLGMPQFGRLEIRVLTCNADSRALDIDAMGALIRDAAPDVVLFQGISRRHLAALFAPGEWDVRAGGGLAIASRCPIHSVERIPDSEVFCTKGEADRYRLETAVGVITVVNLHLATPRYALESVIARSPAAPDELQANSDVRRAQSAEISDWIGGASDPLILAGDFNTLPESAIYREFWSRYTNAFTAAGWGFGNTHFTRHTGVRIDHILADDHWHVNRCWVGPPVGSAHRPLIAELVLKEKGIPFVTDKPRRELRLQLAPAVSRERVGAF